FLPTAPDVFFYRGSPPMKKVIMTVQPDLLQSASKRRQASAVVAPRVLTKKEDDHEVSDQETSTSFPKSIRVQHQPGNLSFKTFFFISYICTLVDCNSISRMQLKKSPM